MAVVSVLNLSFSSSPHINCKSRLFASVGSEISSSGMTGTKRTRSTASTLAASSAAKNRKHTRPGVEAAAQLLALPRTSPSDLQKWNVTIGYYEVMLRAKGGENLVALNRNMKNIAQEWKSANSKGSVVSLSKDQLLDVVIPWKFAKGKPRNALKPLLQSNAVNSVREYSKSAIEYANKISINSSDYDEWQTKAINELCNLNGVGPATASAVLGISHPHHFAFMDDEVIECLYDGKRGYTATIYGEVNEKCMEISKELNSLRDEKGEGGASTEDQWTPYKVGQALWTVATMKAMNEEEGLGLIFCEKDENNTSSFGKKRSKK